MKLAVIYDSKSGNTLKAAEWIAEGMNRQKGAEAEIFFINEVNEEFVKEAKGVVIGGPTYASLMSPALREWLMSAGKIGLAGKLGGAFATEQYTHGGAELVIQSILMNELVFGMLIFSGGGSFGRPVIHIGPVGVNGNTEKHNDMKYYRDYFMIYGERFASKAWELFKEEEKRDHKIAPISPPQGHYIPSRENPDITYLDSLRAKYGSEVYDIDPFIEVFKTSDNSWALRAAGPNAVGDNWCYLVEGPEKALLIDNAYGIGDLKGLCEMLVEGKEVLTAVTHNHGDHSYGSLQWDEVYCHDYCADILEESLRLTEDEYRKKWDEFIDFFGTRRQFFTEEDLVPYKPFKCIHLEDHDMINLGEDYNIELIHTGGHAPGLAVFLDKKGRVLYTGDAIFESLVPGLGIGINGRRRKMDADKLLPPMLHEECLDVRYFASQLRALAKRVNEFDRCADGHGAIDSLPRVVTDLNEAIEAVLKDPHAYTDTVKTSFGTGYIMQRGIANCRYNDPDTLLD